MSAIGHATDPTTIEAAPGAVRRSHLLTKDDDPSSRAPESLLDRGCSVTASQPTTDQLDALTAFDTPTICNAIEVLLPGRRSQGFTSQPLDCADPTLAPMVGYARTATIRAMHPSGRGADGDLAQRLRYYKHVGEAPGPTVTVIADIDPTPGYGAFWGEVQTNVHRGLGSVGVITNGSVRDLDERAEGFQMLSGSVGPSHAWVHVVDVAVPVSVAGMQVNPGDLIHADRHGAVVVPLGIVEQIPPTVQGLLEAESVLITASQTPGFSYEQIEQILTGGGGSH